MPQTPRKKIYWAIVDKKGIIYYADDAQALFCSKRAANFAMYSYYDRHLLKVIPVHITPVRKEKKK